MGGANGIGLAIARELALKRGHERVYIVDKVAPKEEHMLEAFHVTEFDLMSDDFSLFDRYSDIDTLVITAGFGRLAHFSEVEEAHVTASMAVNATAVMRIIHHFYPRCSSR